MHPLLRYLFVPCFVLTLITPTFGRELVIGISPYMGKSDAETQVKSVLHFLTETLEPGDGAFIFNAYHLKSLGRFEVPNKPAYRHPKAKLKANRQTVANLLKFSKNPIPFQGGNHPSVRGAIRLPQFLRFLGENYPVSQETDVMIIGSPLYDDPKDKEFGMTHGHIPGDGHLAHSQKDTPFGIKGQKSLLSKRRIHLGFFNDGWKQNDHHEVMVKRFWTLFIEGQKGMLSTFTSDIPTLFQRVRNGAAPFKHSYVLQRTDKLEMVLFRPATVKHKTSIYERPITTKPLPVKVFRQAYDVEVGVTWLCQSCDVDLYARPKNSAQTLYYQHRKTPEGIYFKDFTSAPAQHGFETIAFNTPVDLNELFVALNFYSGEVIESVEGEVRISVAANTYAAPFQIKATKGNAGKGRKETLKYQKAANERWLVINPITFIGVNSKTPILTKR